VRPLHKTEGIMMAEKKQIIMFWGRRCPHCRAMEPIVQKLEEEGIKFERLEVWENKENADKMRALADIIKPACGGYLGTPAFYDPNRNSALCGEKPYETLKDWALAKIDE